MRISQPALKLALDQMHQHGDAILAVVQTGNVGEFFAAMLEEDFLVLLRDLLERLDAVGCEAGRENRDISDAALRQSLDRLVSVGLDPLGTAEARLEG